MRLPPSRCFVERRAIATRRKRPRSGSPPRTRLRPQHQQCRDACAFQSTSRLWRQLDISPNHKRLCCRPDAPQPSRLRPPRPAEGVGAASAPTSVCFLIDAPQHSSDYVFFLLPLLRATRGMGRPRAPIRSRRVLVRPPLPRPTPRDRTATFSLHLCRVFLPNTATPEPPAASGSLWAVHCHQRLNEFAWPVHPPAYPRVQALPTTGESQRRPSAGDLASVGGRLLTVFTCFHTPSRPSLFFFVAAVCGWGLRPFDPTRAATRHATEHITMDALPPNKGLELPVRNPPARQMRPMGALPGLVPTAPPGPPNRVIDVSLT